jgi:hypothetical protein
MYFLCACCRRCCSRFRFEVHEHPLQLAVLVPEEKGERDEDYDCEGADTPDNSTDQECCSFGTATC